MEYASNETHSESSVEGHKTEKKRKLKSEVWEHFTKIMKENGKCDVCKCNYCENLFSNRSGTSHLHRHITKTCPVLNRKDKSSRNRLRIKLPNVLLPLEIDTVLVQSSSKQQPVDVKVELPRNTIKNPEYQGLESVKNMYGGQTPLPSSSSKQQLVDVKVELPPKTIKNPGYQGLEPVKNVHGGQTPLPLPKEEVWMNEFRSCIAKLAELTNGRIPVGSLQALSVSAPDYSIAAALKCLNELEDIPQSSEMYLDAFAILQDAGERECFICLPPEPRRRWLQRVLHLRLPLRYDYNIMKRRHI